jgi:hypothetical protein
MTTKTEDQVRGALEKALEKHTDKDGTWPAGTVGGIMDSLMSDPDLVAAVKDVDQFVDETTKETIENWKRTVGEE